MADPKIRIRRSATPNKVPTITQLELGELAINTYDGKLYLEQDQGAAGVGNTVVRVNPWNVGVGTTAYNISFTSGKVGIGIDPSMTLHIKGGDENTLKLESTSGEPAIFWAPGSSSLKWEQRASASRWQLYQYDQSEWVFNIYDAKIGIGTVSPSAKLVTLGNKSTSSSLNVTVKIPLKLF